MNSSYEYMVKDLDFQKKIKIQLEKELKNSVVDDIKKLVFDFSTLEYISSAGLRVLLAAQKVMNKQGEMIILNASSDIMEVFDITGFSDILTIK